MAETQIASETAKAVERRSFFTLTAGALGIVGLGAAAWPLIDSLNPAADLRIPQYSDLVDLSDFAEGDRRNFLFRGLGLVFISRRTVEEIAAAKAGDTASLIDPELDSARVQRDEWLMVLGVCTFRRCWVGGQSEDLIRSGRQLLMIEPLKLDRGAFGGWKCYCCGSEYDTSGRVRRGRAPKNLIVPEYRFTAEDTLEIRWLGT